MKTLDLNTDLGESYGLWSMGRDDELLQWVTSANVACGFHAGDPDVMATTVRLVAAAGVALGAHPGLPDRQGFGRRAMAISSSEVYNLVLYQVSALAGFARVAGIRLAHVKLHGALYNQAAAEPALARAVAAAVRDFDPALILFGPAGSQLIVAGQALGLVVAREGFADRRYESDGSLVSRRDADALIYDPEEAVTQVLRMAERGEVLARDGTSVSLPVDTICVHGDTPEAVAFARRLHAELKARNIFLSATAVTAVAGG